MTLRELYEQSGAVLAADGIPLHYGDLAAEYRAAEQAAILLDRSHEGRLVLRGTGGGAFLNRMSTNKMIDLVQGEGRVTLFTNATARLLDRIIAYQRADDLLLITEPGRGQAVQDLLQRNIFFGDQVQIQSLTTQTTQFALHGVQATAIICAFAPQVKDLLPLHSAEIPFADTTIFIGQRKSIVGAHWVIIIPQDYAAQVYEQLRHCGQPYGLLPAGSLTYNTLRIRAGYPAGREVSSEYIPLEVGLWDDISFAKGCYTGQEIIARMDSRERLARILVRLELSQWQEAPADLYHAGKWVGTLTSSVQAPDQTIFALGVVKVSAAQTGTALTIGNQETAAVVLGLAAVPPPYLAIEG